MGECNAFTGMCHSVHGRGGAHGVYLLRCVHGVAGEVWCVHGRWGGGCPGGGVLEGGCPGDVCIPFPEIQSTAVGTGMHSCFHAVFGKFW